MNDLMNFNELFRKNVTSRKKMEGLTVSLENTFLVKQKGMEGPLGFMIVFQCYCVVEFFLSISSFKLTFDSNKCYFF